MRIRKPDIMSILMVIVLAGVVTTVIMQSRQSLPDTQIKTMQIASAYAWGQARIK